MKNVLKIDYFQTLNFLFGGGKSSLLKIAFSFLFLTVAFSCAKEQMPVVKSVSGGTVSVRTEEGEDCECDLTVTSISNIQPNNEWSFFTDTGLTGVVATGTGNNINNTGITVPAGNYTTALLDTSTYLLDAQAVIL